MATGQEANREGLSKAVLLMLNLNRDVLAKVLKHLGSDEVTQVMQHYEQVAAARPSQKKLLDVGREFLESRRHNSSGRFKEALTMAFGSKWTDQILRQDHWRAIADRVDAGALAELLQGERPEAIAIIMAQLPPRYGAKVLHKLPMELRIDTVRRISRAERVPGPALDAILRALEENFKNRVTMGARDENAGFQRAATLLNHLDSETAGAIVETIRDSDTDAAAAIEHEIFHFQDLLKLDSRALQMVLAEARPEHLGLALKGLPAEQREALFAAMPESVAKVVKDEMESAGSVPLREVQAARNELTNIALQLDRENKIRIRAADEEMVA